MENTNVRTDKKSISKERLQQLYDINDKWNLLTKKFGELHFQKKLIDAELQLTDQELDGIEQERLSLVKHIEDEMGGPGEVNGTTGEFTPL
jgi:hypothetical protein